MNYGFLNTDPLLVRTKNGRNVVIQEYLNYLSSQGHNYRVKIGAESDGFSTPCEMWIKYPPFGVGWYSSVFHDGGYRDNLEMQSKIDGTWSKITLTKELIDALFLEAMLSQGVDSVDAHIIFEGVNQFGQQAFDIDRNNYAG